MTQSLQLVPVAGLPLEAVVAVQLSFVVAGAVHLLLWRVRGEAYLALWGVAWFAFAARYLPQLWGAPLDLQSPFAIFGTLRDLLFVGGASLYAGRGWWRGWVVVALLEAGLMAAGSLTHPTLGAVAALARSGIAVVALGITAIALLRSARPSSGGRRLTATGLFLITLVVMITPALATEAHGLLAVALQLGVLTVALGVAFAELDEASALRLAALAALEGTMQHALRGRANLCSDCGRVEASDGAWRAPEEFIRSATNAPVTHGICPSCTDLHFGTFDDQSVGTR